MALLRQGAAEGEGWWAISRPPVALLRQGATGGRGIDFEQGEQEQQCAEAAEDDDDDVVDASGVVAGWEQASSHSPRVQVS